MPRPPASFLPSLPERMVRAVAATFGGTLCAFFDSVRHVCRQLVLDRACSFGEPRRPS